MSSEPSTSKKWPASGADPMRSLFAQVAPHAVLLCAALASAQSLAQGADASPEFRRDRLAADSAAPSASRLESLRNSLIDQALAAPVRVSSSAWIDESGRMRHVSRFLSEVRARSAADLAFSAEGGEAPAGLKEPQAHATHAAMTTSAPHESLSQRSVSAGQQSLANKGGALESSCQAERSGLQRVAAVHTELVPGDGARGHAVLHDAARVYEEALRRLASSGGVVLAASAAIPMNAYDRLLSSTGAADTPYRVEIRLSSDREDVPPHGQGAHPGKGPIRQTINALAEVSREFSTSPLALLPSRRLDLDVALRELVSQRVVSRHTAVVHVPGSSPSHTSQSLPDVSVEALRMAAKTWWAEVVSGLSCDPIVVRADAGSGGRVSIPMGAGAGVRLGDKWLVADRSKIPSRVLEEGAIDRALLAEVVTVLPHRSVLKFTPDASQTASRLAAERGVTWFATPM